MRLASGLVWLVLITLPFSPLAAQAEGSIAGQVRETGTRRGLGRAEILVDGRLAAVADTGGAYRARSIRTGWHRVAARLIGYRGVVLDSVLVPAGAAATVDFQLEQNAGAGAGCSHCSIRSGTGSPCHQH